MSTEKEIVVPGVEITKVDSLTPDNVDTKNLNCFGKCFWTVELIQEIPINPSIESLGIDIKYKNVNNPGLFPPYVMSFFNPGTTIDKISPNPIDRISINATVIIERKFGDLIAKTNGFNVNAQLVFNQDGEYQLNIYISFEGSNPESEDSNQYNQYEFDIIFNKGSIKVIKPNNEVKVIDDLLDIKTIETHIIQTDPRASRGTQTRVVDGGA